MINKIVTMLLIITSLISCIGNKSNERVDSDEDQTVESILQSNDGDMFMLIGTYTSENGSKGIYVNKLNILTGASDSISMVEMENPSYLTLSPDMKFVYAVCEGGEKNSFVNSFSFDREKGLLTPINFQPTIGADPCYITIDSKGENIHTANYSGGSITTFQVNSEGIISAANSVLFFEGNGPDSVRQSKSHLHSVMYSPDGKFIFATDLGTDKLYRISVLDSPFEGQPSLQQNSLKEFSLPSGTGPRHFDFHPDGGRFLYLLGELSGEVLVFNYNNGTPDLVQTIASDTTGARGSADIHVSPDGRFLYASNRLNADGISIFQLILIMDYSLKLDISLQQNILETL